MNKAISVTKKFINRTQKSPRRLHTLITAGPTREMIDPVRFLSNVSTGEMGYQLAREAERRGFQVTLISGPTNLIPPKGVTYRPVVSASEMERAVKRYFRLCDVLIMTAAVCDYTPVRKSPQKIRRIERKHIAFKRTRDILQSISSRKGNRLVMGFCLETENLLRNAIRKLRLKRLDLIVANEYKKGKNPFGQRKSSVVLIDKYLHKKALPKWHKSKLARHLLAWVVAEKGKK